MRRRQSSHRPPNDQEAFHLLMENVQDYAIFFTDPDGHILTWNTGAERILGYQEAEVVGCLCDVIFVPEDRANGEPLRERSSAARAGRGVDERWHVRKDGSRFWASGIMTALRDEAGNLRGYAKILRDLTEQKKTQDLISRQARFLELAYDALFVHDLTNTITFWNPAAEDLYGFSRAEALGKVAHVLLKTVFPVSFEETMTVLLETDHWQGELIHTGKDGRQRIVASRWALQRNADGQPESILEINRDITDQKRDQAHIEALNDRLQRAMTETHHRVKNNLQIIGALLEMLSQTDAEMVSVSDLRRVEQHLHAMTNLHALLTDAMKVDAGTSKISAKTVLEKLLPLLENSAGGRTLVYDIEEVLLPIKTVTSLSVLVNELVSNAIKHGRGTIEVRLTVAGQEVQLAVSDQGRGFPEGFVARQAANTGLELVGSVVHIDLAGEADYQNRPERGACVLVRFPIPH